MRLWWRRHGLSRSWRRRRLLAVPPRSFVLSLAAWPESWAERFLGWLLNERTGLLELALALKLLFASVDISRRLGVPILLTRITVFTAGSPLPAARRRGDC
jgi:hypothetical protein